MLQGQPRERHSEMPVPAVAMSVADRISSAGPRLMGLTDIAAEWNPNQRPGTPTVRAVQPLPTG